MQDILGGLKASSSTADPSYVSEVVCLLEDSDAEMLKASAIPPLLEFFPFASVDLLSCSFTRETLSM